jgi:hypothetical protein
MDPPRDYISGTKYNQISRGIRMRTRMERVLGIQGRRLIVRYYNLMRLRVI